MSPCCSSAEVFGGFGVFVGIHGVGVGDVARLGREGLGEHGRVFHSVRLKLIEIGIQNAQPFHRIIIPIKVEPAVAGVVVLFVERLEFGIG